MLRTVRAPNVVPYPQRVCSATGCRSLEVGVGTGLNLPVYSDKAGHVGALYPSSRLLDRAQKERGCARCPVDLLEGSADAIPLQDRSVDTVVTTWTLCTIPNVSGALGEMRRVLTPGGQLLFVEHGRSPDESVRRWQDRLTPAWKCIGGGCHLNRGITARTETAGLDRKSTRLNSSH